LEKIAMLTNLISEAEYAKQRGICIRSAQRERALRIGPPYVKLGRRVFYRPETISEWILAQERSQPRAEGAAR
jgi:hypothetical protein